MNASGGWDVMFSLSSPGHPEWKERISADLIPVPRVGDSFVWTNDTELVFKCVHVLIHYSLKTIVVIGEIVI